MSDNTWTIEEPQPPRNVHRRVMVQLCCNDGPWSEGHEPESYEWPHIASLCAAAGYAPAKAEGQGEADEEPVGYVCQSGIERVLSISPRMIAPYTRPVYFAAPAPCPKCAEHDKQTVPGLVQYNEVVARKDQFDRELCDLHDALREATGTRGGDAATNSELLSLLLKQCETDLVRMKAATARAEAAEKRLTSFHHTMAEITGTMNEWDCGSEPGTIEDVISHTKQHMEQHDHDLDALLELRETDAKHSATIEAYRKDLAAANARADEHQSSLVEAVKARRDETKRADQAVALMHSTARAANEAREAAEARIVALETEADANAWKVSPAMAQAKIDELTTQLEAAVIVSEKRRERAKAAERALQEARKALDGRASTIKAQMIELDASTTHMLRIASELDSARKALEVHERFVALFDDYRLNENTYPGLIDARNKLRSALPTAAQPAKSCMTCAGQKTCLDADEPIGPRSSVEACWRPQPSQAKTCDTCGDDGGQGISSTCLACQDFDHWYADKPHPTPGAADDTTWWMIEVAGPQWLKANASWQRFGYGCAQDGIRFYTREQAEAVRAALIHLIPASTLLLESTVTGHKFSDRLPAMNPTPAHPLPAAVERVINAAESLSRVVCAAANGPGYNPRITESETVKDVCDAVRSLTQPGSSQPERKGS